MTYYEKQNITEQEYNRILLSLEQQEVQVRDIFGTRWVKCRDCGQAITIHDSWFYGGVGQMNIGECYQCKIKKLKGNIRT